MGCCLDFIILVKGDTCYDIYMGEVITKYNSIYSFIRCHNCFFELFSSFCDFQEAPKNVTIRSEKVK